MVFDQCAGHGDRRSGAGGRDPETLLRHEPAPDPRHDLPGRTQLLESPHARRQPLCLRLVVSQRVHRARRRQGQNPLAALRRHQLSRRHLAQWQKDRRQIPSGRRVSHLRLRRHRRSRRRQAQRARGRDLRTHRKRPRHQLGGLEPLPRRQRHGPLGRGRSRRQRPGLLALAARRYPFSRPLPRRGRPHRLRRAAQRRRSDRPRNRRRDRRQHTRLASRRSCAARGQDPTRWARRISRSSP